MLMDLPEICPSINANPNIYLPDFVLNHEYYIERYNEKDLMSKIVDNKGNGFIDLYGTRNLRPILHGVAYRGGANNYYHKTNKRKTQSRLMKKRYQLLRTYKNNFTNEFKVPESKATRKNYDVIKNRQFGL